MINNFEKLVKGFNESFDFERYCCFEEPPMLELIIPNHGQILLDGLKTVLVCSKSYTGFKDADIVFDMEGLNEFFF